MSSELNLRAGFKVPRADDSPLVFKPVLEWKEGWYSLPMRSLFSESRGRSVSAVPDLVNAVDRQISLRVTQPTFHLLYRWNASMHVHVVVFIPLFCGFICFRT